MDYLLAIDQGTHASRALLFDAQGQQIARHLVPVTLKRPQANRAEQDPGEILDSVRAAVAQTILSLAPAERGNIRACGLTTQRSTVLAWQANGAPLSAAISWQDTRGAPLVDSLQTHATEIREQSGLPLSAHYGASKLHWLHQLLVGEPGLRLGPLASFLLTHLTGTGHVIDHSNAQRMQLMDVDHLDWSHRLADWFGVPLDRLPECRPVMGDYGLLADYAIPVTAVCGDQNAAWHGSGMDARYCALVNLGSGAFVLATQRPGNDIPELLSSLSVSDARGAEWLLEGTVNGAGSALEWLAEQGGIDDLPTRLPDWLDQVTDPPLFMNSVGGIGSPWWRPPATPVFLPGDASWSSAECAVAVVESIVFLLQCNLERMLHHTTIECLRVSGGLSQLDGLCQKLANLSELPVERCTEAEASARGVAWLAAGRPADWLASTHLPRFNPQPDTALRSRYHRFVDLLQQPPADADDR
jgi:glycerol kinase